MDHPMIAESYTITVGVTGQSLRWERLSDVRMPAPHAPEFRPRAFELARQEDCPVAQGAKGLQISEPCCQTGSLRLTRRRVAAKG